MQESGSAASANANTGELTEEQSRALRGYVLVQVLSNGDSVPRRVLISTESGELLNEGLWQISGKERPFPEKMFQTEFSKERLVTLIEALKLAIDKEEQDGIQSIEKDYSYSIVVTSYEKLYLPVHLNEITLEHPLQNEESDIALFVMDLEDANHLDFKPTIQHYENLLRNKDVKYKITVIPVNQLDSEFATTEARRKLTLSYDKFLVDCSAVRQVNGGEKLENGRVAVPVDLTKDALTYEIERALRRVFYMQSREETVQFVRVGKHSMSTELIAENIIDLIRQFGKEHPGGYCNIHKLHLRNLTASIPIYVSAAKPVDGVPSDTTNQGEFDDSAKVLEEFGINAAEKLVQKHDPSTRFLSDGEYSYADKLYGIQLPVYSSSSETIESTMKRMGPQLNGFYGRARSMSCHGTGTDDDGVGSSGPRNIAPARLENEMTKEVCAESVESINDEWMSKVRAEKPAFPDELFKTTFSKEKLGTLVEALKLTTDKEVQDSIRLLEEDYIYSIVITSHKVPPVPVHLSRIILKNSLLNEESEIALFVKDLKCGRRLDTEPTIQHYENLLRNKDVKYRITVIPVNQLYNEFATFETRRKLAFLYDKFLVDRSVAAHVNGFLGSKMMQKGRLALPVDLSKVTLNDEIDQAVRKVFYEHGQRGITQSIQVGKHSMSKELIAENIIDLMRQFGDVHPGGYKNVHKLHLVNSMVSIPIYTSASKPVDDVPGGMTNQEEFTNEQSDKAVEKNFDINAAGKLVQKRCLSRSLLSDDVLLSDDEKYGNEPLPKRAHVATGAGPGTESYSACQ